MGGIMSAKVVPCAWCREKPNRNTRAWTMIPRPPPIPVNPLKIRAAKPRSTWNISWVILRLPRFWRRLSVGLAAHHPSTAPSTCWFELNAFMDYPHRCFSSSALSMMISISSVISSWWRALRLRISSDVSFSNRWMAWSICWKRRRFSAIKEL